MNKTAFIAGATGFTGREVVRLLCEMGVETVAHIRPDSSRFDQWMDQFQSQGAVVDNTPWALDAIANTLRQRAPDDVFFLIGTTRARDRQSEDDNSYRAVDYGLFRLLLDACIQGEISPTILYLSAMGTGPNPRTAYYRARWDCEKDLRACGLSYRIARPGIITGPGREDPRPMERLGGALADGLAASLRLVGARRLADRYGSITNTELARALVQLALDDNSPPVVESEELQALARRHLDFADDETTSVPSS